MTAWIKVKDLDPGNSFRVLVRHDDLIHPDWNPEGIAEGCLFPEENGTRDAECVFWDGQQDCFYSNLVQDVQDVMLLPKFAPQEQEYLEEEIAEEERLREERKQWERSEMEEHFRKHPHG